MTFSFPEKIESKLRPRANALRKYNYKAARVKGNGSEAGKVGSKCKVMCYHTGYHFTLSHEVTQPVLQQEQLLGLME